MIMDTPGYRKIYNIEGIIQGVGFRPALYCYAVDSGLGGWVKNCSGKVELAIEGSSDELDKFINDLVSNLPEQARIDSLELVSTVEINKKSTFRILESEKDSLSKISIPADLAMCRDCETEMLTPGNRRYGYPFTTCVNCGPRYTVVNSMPYDRCRTTLADFPLCSDCEKEYTDPGNRRFHAESTACPKCGPELWIADSEGKNVVLEDPILYTVKELKKGKIAAIRGIGGYLFAVDAFNDTSLGELRRRKNRPHKPFAVMVRDIKTAEKYCFVSEKEKETLNSSAAPIVILDVCGESEKENYELRITNYEQDQDNDNDNDQDKDNGNDNKVETQYFASNKEREQRSEIRDLPMHFLSPDSDTLGVMLPYTPLHRLLFEESDFELLVMTSANRGGEPICIENEEAYERLNGIADFYLSHNREINLRSDDSLCIMQGGELQVWRRARGYAPNSIKVTGILQEVKDNRSAATFLSLNVDDKGVNYDIGEYNSNKNILSMGAELKNTITVLSDNEAVISPHIGDLITPEAVDGLKQVVECFPKFLNRKPDVIVADTHPDMHSTRVGKRLADDLDIPFVQVFHHFAHAVSCMAENNLDEALALVFDGTGLGDDDSIWGAELLYCDLEQAKENYELRITNYEKTKEQDKNTLGYKRLATFVPAPLPGGDAAVYHPVRQLIARLVSTGTNVDHEFLKAYSVTETEYKIWKIQTEKSINAPLTHAAGRLFDAFSSLLKIAPDKITYEGQGAIRLEAYAKRAKDKKNKHETRGLRSEIREMTSYKVVVKDSILQIDWSGMFRELYNKKVWNLGEHEKEMLAFSFHVAVADAAVKMVEFGLKDVRTVNVVLSGGVFMNRILTSLIKEKLERQGLKVYIHKKVPPNDGGISFGQSVIARIKNKK